MRNLAMPAPLCMRTAIVVDVALRAADKIRHDSRSEPRALFAVRLKQLVLRHAACRAAVQ